MSDDVEDRRRPDQIAKAMRVPMTTDFELLAARAIKNYTGAHVVIQDDGSQHGMPDIRIEYPDGQIAVAEVWQDLGRDDAALASHLAEQSWQYPGDSLGRVWFLELSGRFRMKDAEKRVIELLAGLTAEGLNFETIGQAEFLRNHPSPLVQKALEMGITTLSSREPRDGEPLAVYLTPPGIHGPADVTWEPFLDWIKETLSADNANMRGNRAKLARSGRPERHAFLGVTYSSPWAVFHALTWWANTLPPIAPQLPPEITHLWLMNSQAPDRCLAWFPGRGWIEASTPFSAPQELAPEQ